MTKSISSSQFHNMTELERKALFQNVDNLNIDFTHHTETILETFLTELKRGEKTPVESTITINKDNPDKEIITLVISKK